MYSCAVLVVVVPSPVSSVLGSASSILYLVIVSSVRHSGMMFVTVSGGVIVSLSSNVFLGIYRSITKCRNVMSVLNDFALFL